MVFIYVTGQSSGPQINLGFITIKYDSTGTEMWVARYNNAVGSNDHANTIGLDALGNIYISGTNSNNIGSSILTLKYSFFTSLEENIVSSTDISVFPNPFVDQIHINSTHALLNSKFIMYDLTGRIILELSCTNKSKLSMPRHLLQNGLYVYIIKQDNLILTRGKIVAN